MNRTFPAVVRLAHFSDLHVTVRPLGWKTGDWFNKRLPGWLNLVGLGRGERFRDAARIVTCLAQELPRQRLDHLLFTGDATALGFAAELRQAVALLNGAGPGFLPGLAVPGNHDYYIRGAANTGLFEELFAPWQVGERVDNATYPFAQRVGPLWLVAVCSSTGNRWFWDAAGSVGAAQRARLATLLGRLTPGPRILVTHYPLCLASGAPERWYRGLRDLPEVLDVAVRGGVCLWLHGHRHGAYHHRNCDRAPFPIICAGSATQKDRWSYGEYTIDGWHLEAVRRIYSPGENRFEDAETFALDLPQRTANV